MSTNNAQVLGALVTQLRTLVSHDDFKTSASLVDEFEQAKSQSTAKDAEIARLKKEIADLQAKHEKSLDQGLEAYCVQKERLDKEKAELSKRVATLTTNIKELQENATQSKRAQQELQVKLTKVGKDLEAEKKRIENSAKQTEGLQQKLKSKDIDIIKLRQDLETERKKSTEIKNRLEGLGNRHALLEQDLLAKKERLGELESSMVKLYDADEEVWGENLDRVWESARLLIETLFQEDIPEEMLKDPSAWRRLEKPSSSTERVPLPRSNTIDAKRMRSALLLAVLARSIDTHLFQATYIVDGDETIGPLLFDLALTDSKKEALLRSILLSISPEDQKRNITKCIGRVMNETLDYVHDLLPKSRYEGFRTDLQRVVESAAKAWEPIQHATEKFKPLFAPKYFEDFEWQPLQFSQQKKNEAKLDIDGNDPVLVIFPRMYSIEDIEPDPLTDGVALMRWQTDGAADEIEKICPPSPTANKRNQLPRRGRRQSVSANGAMTPGGPFLSQEAPQAKA